MESLTLAVAFIVVCFSIFSAILVIYGLCRNKYLLFFAFAFACLGLGSAALILEIRTDQGIWIVFSQMLRMTGYLLMLSGARSFFMDPQLWPASFWSYLVLVLGNVLFFTFVVHSALYRSILFSLAVIALSVQHLRYIRHRFQPADRLFRYTYLLALWATVAMNLVRLVWTIRVRDDLHIDNTLLNDSLSSVTFLNLMIWAILWLVVIILMQSKELLDLIEKKKQQYELAIAGSNDGIWDLDLINNIAYYSPRWKEQLGYEGSELSNEFSTYRNLVHPDDAELADFQFGQVLRGEVPMLDVTIRKRHKDGNYRWFQVRGKVLLDQNGTAIRIAGSCTDVTDLKIWQDQIKASEEKYRLIAENTSDVIWVFNVTLRRVTYFSPSIQQLLGYTPEEALLLQVEDMNLQESSMAFQEEVSKAMELLRQNPERPVEMRNEVQQRCKNGTIVWVEYCTRYHYNEHQEIEAVGVSRNIDQRKRTEDVILYLSYRDYLTGLYNRRFFEEELKRLDTPRNLPISIVMGDLNRLKLVNDAFGHEKGDELIKKAADAMRTSCRPEDIISRWGGDEFVILLPKTSQEDAKSIICRIEEACSLLSVNQIPVSISFGVETKVDPGESVSAVINKAETAMYSVKSKKSERNRSEIVSTISEELYKKYPAEENHAARVSRYCRNMAKAMGLPDQEVKKAELAGLMHDIGKVAVKVEILTKSSPLNQEELAEIKKHSAIGAKIVGTASEMVEIGQAILAHHERIDGTGYPNGIKSDQIPIYSRMIAIAEAYDSMIHGQHHRSMSKEEAMAELRKNQGNQFDEGLVDLFIEQIIRKEE